MNDPIRLIDDTARADEVLNTYRVAHQVFLLGSLATGVTIYKQQVRAHNLACALASSSLSGRLKSLAVIGGGVSGLTLVAALAILLPDARVTLLEQRTDLCPLQQGSETRWVHPHIYDWPKVGSRAPDAGLPLLNWSEGTAGEVAETMLRQFSNLVGRSRPRGQTAAPKDLSLALYTAVSDIKIDIDHCSIKWTGVKGEVVDGHVVSEAGHQGNAHFDAIIVASGFGLEEGPDNAEVLSYWRNDPLGQPILTNGKQTYIISGYGDGAIVDLCRLCIERFRQGQVLRDLWGSELGAVENRLKDVEFHKLAIERKLESLYEEHADFASLVKETAAGLTAKLRKDVLVILSMRGNGTAPNTSIWQALSGRSSPLNKLLLMALFEAKAFLPRFETIDALQTEYGVPDRNVVVRHGTSALDNVLRLFEEPDVISATLKSMRQSDSQSPEVLWPPGRFGPEFKEK